MLRQHIIKNWNPISSLPLDELCLQLSLVCRINRDIARALYFSSNFWHWLGGSTQMVQLGAVLEKAGVTGTHMNNWTLWAFSDSAWFICCLRPGWGSANYFKTIDHSFAGKKSSPSLSLHYHLCSVFAVPRSGSLRAQCSIDHTTKALLTYLGPVLRLTRWEIIMEENGGTMREGVHSDLSPLLVFSL